MIIKNNSDGDKWIDITNNLILFKKHNKTKVICWKAKGKLKFCNFRFNIYKYKPHERMNIKNFRCFIRLPFFYWEKHNNGWKIGTPNIYFRKNNYF